LSASEQFNATDTDRTVIGRSIQDLDTPALLLDLKASDRNIRRMASYFADKKAKLRPHFKNHKCTTLARRQLEAGAVVGFTCAKVGEAEVLARHGFDDILIANQVVGELKVQRLVDVARTARISVAVDAAAQSVAISRAAVEAGVTVGILVEIDIGMGRCGVPPGEPAVELARQVQGLEALRFEGIQAFEGHLIFVNDAAARESQVLEALQKALDTRRLLEARGIPVREVSGGSTANYRTAAGAGGLDSVQAGTYATMDWRYHQVTPEFDIALSVVATVISTRPGEAVLDVGVKGAGGEFGHPQVVGAPDVQIPFFLAEEHCVVKSAPPWKVGDTVQLIPSHACTTCNLHRKMHVHEDGRVVDVWPIEASGMLA